MPCRKDLMRQGVSSIAKGFRVLMKWTTGSMITRRLSKSTRSSRSRDLEGWTMYWVSVVRSSLTPTLFPPRFLVRAGSPFPIPDICKNLIGASLGRNTGSPPLLIALHGSRTRSGPMHLGLLPRACVVTACSGHTTLMARATWQTPNHSMLNWGPSVPRSRGRSLLAQGRGSHSTRSWLPGTAWAAWGCNGRVTTFMRCWTTEDRSPGPDPTDMARR